MIPKYKDKGLENYLKRKRNMIYNHLDKSTELYLREYKDEGCFSWGYIYLNGLSKDFIIEFKEYLHPKNINEFKQKWNRIYEIVKLFGKKFYMDTFDNYGYIDEW